MSCKALYSMYSAFLIPIFRKAGEIMTDRTSVGEIALDLVVNRNGFDRMMNSITGLAKKAGATLAGALAVDKIIDFGKSCLDLGSDLSEVQNVVDVTFQTMSDKVDKFARSAVGNFGLSETMAKKFTGTFGSMADAFGFSEKEAYKMSTALTGLAGDVASFYNISQDEAYTKLKSVFSGETETLKDLGIVMTQSALDAYALANGYGKTTAKMTEAEKVSLRFAFVQEKLSNATGDFIRTSNSWANQIRILSLQFDSLKASIGQGLINVFTPVIKWMNLLLLKITVVADKFKEFTELITGNKGSGSSSGSSTAAAETADSMSSASESAASTADSTSKTVKNLKKASRFLAGFDKITKMNSKDKTSDSGKTGGTGVGSGSGVKVKVDTSNLDKTSKKLDKLKNAFLALKNRFVKGFKIGLGDTSVLDSIKNNMKSIMQSIQDMASDKDVQASLKNMFLSLAESTGKIAGSFASIGLTIADNLTGGISKYLKQNTGRIKKYLISMFDITANIGSIVADFTAAVADIFTVFRSNDAKQITADLIKIVNDALMGINELMAKYGRDILKTLTQPIVENKDTIKKALEDTLKPVRTIVSSIADLVADTFDKANEVYDTYLEPAFENVKKGLSKILSAALEGYNEYLLPVFNGIAKSVEKLAKEYIQPLIDSFLELTGKASEAASMLWNFLSPFIGWFVKKFIAEIATKLQWLWVKVEAVVSVISVILKGIFDVLSGLIDFIVGVFTLDWDKAWTGIKEIFSAVWNTIKGLVKAAINTIKSIITAVLTKVYNKIKVVLDGIRLIFGKAWDKIKALCSAFNKFMKNTFKTDFSKNFGALGDIMNGFAKNVSNIWKSVKTIFSGITTFIYGVFKGDWKKAWQGVKKVFKGIFDGLVAVAKAPLNLIIGLINGMLSGVFKGMNWLIKKVNTFKIDVPDWVPKIGGQKWGFDIKPIDTSKFKIPPLAKGGYVKANTPQLAMIGDNRHQGEYVAPEGMLYDLICKAVKNSSKNNNTNNTTQQEKDINLNLVLEIGGTKFANIVAKAINQESRRQGKCIIKTT